MVTRRYYTNDSGAYVKQETLDGEGSNSPASVMLRSTNLLCTLFCIYFTYKAYDYGVKDLIERNMINGNSKFG